MKKTANAAYCLTIALWPIVFIFGITRLETHIRMIVSTTYVVSYNYWLVIPYAVSGVIFAVIGSCQKESCKRKEIVCAYIAAAIMLILLSLAYLLHMTGVASFGIVYIKPFLLAFILGFTLYTAVKSVIYYRK